MAGLYISLSTFPMRTIFSRIFSLSLSFSFFSFLLLSLRSPRLISARISRYVANVTCDTSRLAFSAIFDKIIAQRIYASSTWTGSMTIDSLWNATIVIFKKTIKNVYVVSVSFGSRVIRRIREGTDRPTDLPDIPDYGRFTVINRCRSAISLFLVSVYCEVEKS